MLDIFLSQLLRPVAAHALREAAQMASDMPMGTSQSFRFCSNSKIQSL
jgi:hypothetical protein